MIASEHKTRAGSKFSTERNGVAVIEAFRKLNLRWYEVVLRIRRL